MRWAHSSSSELGSLIGFRTALPTGLITAGLSSAVSSDSDVSTGVNTLRATGCNTGRCTGASVSESSSSSVGVSASNTGGPLDGGPPAGFAGAPSRIRRPPPGGPRDDLTTSEKSGVSSEGGVGSTADSSSSEMALRWSGSMKAFPPLEVRARNQILLRSSVLVPVRFGVQALLP